MCSSQNHFSRVKTRIWSVPPLRQALTRVPFRDKRYVRVVGNLKTFANKRYINAISIRPVTDPHEIYFHILETIAVALTLERGMPNHQSNTAATSHSTQGVSAYSPSTTGINNTSEQVRCILIHSPRK